jgi:hypothetical protein
MIPADYRSTGNIYIGFWFHICFIYSVDIYKVIGRTGTHGEQKTHCLVVQFGSTAVYIKLKLRLLIYTQRETMDYEATFLLKTLCITSCYKNQE